VDAASFPGCARAAAKRAARARRLIDLATDFTVAGYSYCKQRCGRRPSFSPSATRSAQVRARAPRRRKHAVRRSPFHAPIAAPNCDPRAQRCLQHAFVRVSRIARRHVRGRRRSFRAASCRCASTDRSSVARCRRRRVARRCVIDSENPCRADVAMDSYRDRYQVSGHQVTRGVARTCGNAWLAFRVGRDAVVRMLAKFLL
jgi:hypothetical protein